MLTGTVNRQRVQIAYRNRVYSEYVLNQKMRAQSQALAGPTIPLSYLISVGVTRYGYRAVE